MINKNEKTKSIIIIGAVLILFLLCVIQLNEEEIIATSAQNNKTIEWGIKRESNNMQPDFGSENKLLIDKNNGIAMGNDIDKCIYLTFDEGYEAGYTSKILDILKENNVKATFFITAHYLNTASELVQRMIEEGHIIGNQFQTMVKDHI